MLQSVGLQRVGHDLVTEKQHSCVDHVSPLFLVRGVVWLLATSFPRMCFPLFPWTGVVVSLHCLVGGASLLHGHPGSVRGGVCSSV